MDIVAAGKTHDKGSFPHSPDAGPEPRAVVFAAGMRAECPECMGHGVVMSYPALSHCWECLGKGSVIRSYGPKDADQHLYELLYQAEKERIGRGLALSERSALRQRVRNCR